MDELKKLKSIRICKADKGGKLVLINSNDYVSKMNSLLSDASTYRKLNFNPLSKMQSFYNAELKKLIHEFPEDRGFLSSFLSTLPSLPYAYGLPKVHKQDTPLRPIISNVNSPSYVLSKKLAKLLSSLVGTFSNCNLRHTSDLISKLKDVNPYQCKLISFDVCSLLLMCPSNPL